MAALSARRFPSTGLPSGRFAATVKPGGRPTGSAGTATPAREPRASILEAANFAFGDGSVRFLKNSINLQAYCSLGSRNGAEVVSADSY